MDTSHRAPTPASLRLVQPHPGLANLSTRLRSRSVATPSSPIEREGPQPGPPRGHAEGVAHQSSGGRHGHSTSDLENQVPLSYHTGFNGKGRRDSFGSSSRMVSQEHRANALDGESRYQQSFNSEGDANLSMTDLTIRDGEIGDTNRHHTSQHSFSHPSTNSGPSRHLNQFLVTNQPPQPRWKQSSNAYNDEADTPRASGIVDDNALPKYDNAGSVYGGTMIDPSPVTRSTQFAGGDVEVEPHEAHAMPPITLGVLRHHPQAASVDSSDNDPMHSYETHPTTSIAPPPPAAFMAPNERVIMIELANSKDQGDTLDLSRKGIERIGEGDVQILRHGVGKGGKGVWRLALSYNHLQHYSFDRSLNMLTRLRYLNLKGNKLTQLPAVLTEMPSLEILDVSKNDITELPEDPGRLVQLRVFSLTRNKLGRLPGYLAHFANLRVLKVEENPITWPPPEILGLLPTESSTLGGRDRNGRPNANKDDDMRIWIANIKDWMRSQEQEQIRLLAEGMNNVSGNVNGSPPSPAETNRSEESCNAATSAVDTDMPATPVEMFEDASIAMMRTTSNQSTLTSRPGSPIASKAGLSSSQTRPLLRSRQRSQTAAAAPVPVVALGITRSASSGSLPPGSRNDEASASTPSSHLTFPPTETHLARESSNSSITTVKNTAAGHVRGSSYTGEHRLSIQLSSKKSLPDLRQSLTHIMGERLGTTALDDTTYVSLSANAHASSSSLSTPAAGTLDPPLYPPAARALSSKPSMPNLTMSAVDPPKGQIVRKASDDVLRRMSKAQDKIGSRPGYGAGPSINGGNLARDDLHNSYFRRLSTLPVSSISKAVPPSLLHFVDGIRGLLFAISQSYAALRQYLVFAAHERVAGVFFRVMDPASEYMNLLINALDRFDAVTRRRMPPASVIRQVLEACRDNVAVFAKVIAVLELQITALADVADARYTKTLLLLLYGSLAEVSSSWTAMAPMIQDIRQLLRQEPLPPTSAAGLGHRVGASVSSAGRTPISPIPEKIESSPKQASPTPTETTPHVFGGTTPLASGQEITPTRHAARAREISRRNAGSFSADDVQMGMMLGPADFAVNEVAIGSSDSGILLASTRGAREVKLLNGPVLEEDEERFGDSRMSSPAKARQRRAVSDDIHMMTAESVDPPLEPPRAPFAQSRHGQSSSTGKVNLSTGSGSSFSPKPRGQLYGEGGLPPPPTPGSAATIVDDGVLDTLEQASDIAYTVWVRVQDDLSFPPSSNSALYSPGGLQLAPPPLGSIEVSPKTIPPPSHRSKRVRDLLATLGIAEELTRKLREALMEVRAYDFDQNLTPAGSSGSSARSLIPAQARLSTDAQSFIRIVVKVSEQIIKLQNSREHTFPTSVKTLLAKLTTKTRECGILMQVSTLKPGGMSIADSYIMSSRGSSSTLSSKGGGPRSYSPVFSYNHHQPGSSSDLSAFSQSSRQGIPLPMSASFASRSGGT